MSGSNPQPLATYRASHPRRSRSKSQPSETSLSPELEALARWMDGVFRIPGLGIRFGLDAILGLIPGLGDLVSSFASLYILSAANRYNVPRITLVRMALNIVLDTTLGAVPLVGDVFDAFWKSNLRNVELLRRHMAATPASAQKLQRSDRWFVILLVAALCALMIAAAVVAYWILSWLGSLLFRSAG